MGADAVHTPPRMQQLPASRLCRDEYIQLKRVRAFVGTPAAHGTVQVCSDSAFISTKITLAAWDQYLLPICFISVRRVIEDTLLNGAFSV